MKSWKKNLKSIMVLPFLGLMFHTLASAQEILPPMPKGPLIKGRSGQNGIDIPTIGELGSAVRAYRLGEYTRALELATRLAARGDGNAAALAGYINEYELVENSSVQNAIRFYRSGITLGSYDAMIGLGRMALNSNNDINTTEAQNALEKALSNGRNDAAPILGDLLNNGTSDAQTLQRALDLYIIGANAGDEEAAYKAAIMLDDGDANVPDDLPRAFSLLKSAAEKNFVLAQTDLGLYYYLGKGTSKDLNEAARWFKAGAENGDSEAAFYWAVVNAKGEGTPQNLEIAHRFAQIAAPSAPRARNLLAQIERAMAIQNQTKSTVNH